MKISVLVPVRIHEADSQRINMLAECLESIRAQEYPNYEIILKDGSIEPVKFNRKIGRLLYGMPQVVYMPVSDKSMTDGLNQALWYSNGDILHIICGDDMASDKDTFSFVAEQFAKHDEPAWIYGSTKCANEDSSEGPWGTQPPSTLKEMLLHNCMGTPATYWNRAMMEQVGYFRYELASDYDYWCRCYRITNPMYTQRVLGIGRRWNQAASWSNSALVEKEALEIAVLHSAEYKEKRKPEYVRYTP